MSIECVKCGSRVHGCFPCRNCGCELPPILTGEDSIIAKLQAENQMLHEAIEASENERKQLRKECDELQEENERFKVMLQTNTKQEY